MLLTVDHLSVFYGAVQALRDVSFTVGKGEIVSLIGANGAGKSTTLRALSGVVRPSAGSIVHDGSIDRGSPVPPDRAPGDRPRPGGSRRLRQHERPGEPRDGGVHPLLQKRGGGELRTGLRPVSPPGGTREPARRDLVRRRAADAGHREGSRPAARPAASRRAVHGVVPRAGERDLPVDRGDQQGGNDDPPRRAERLHGPRHRGPRLRPRGGGDRPRREGVRSAGRSEGPGRLPGSGGGAEK